VWTLPAPAFANSAKDGAPPSIGDTGEINRTGHPPNASAIIAKEPEIRLN